MVEQFDGSTDGSTGIVAKISYPDGTIKNFAYPESSSSGFIIKDILDFAREAGLKIDEMSLNIKKFESSRGLRDGGLDAGINVNPVSGSGGVYIKRKPKSEIQTELNIHWREETT